MDEFTQRQFILAKTQFDDLRNERINLDAFLKRIEALSRALGQRFWEEKIFIYALDLEQINASVVEERRMLTALERQQADTIARKMEICFGELDIETWRDGQSL